MKSEFEQLSKSILLLDSRLDFIEASLASVVLTLFDHISGGDKSIIESLKLEFEEKLKDSFQDIQDIKEERKRVYLDLMKQASPDKAS